MKIFLDDERAAPEGWVRCYWPDEVIALFEKGGVTHISLDHDLGDDTKGTGYTFLLYLEEKVLNNPDLQIPTIIIHSQNSSGVDKMRMALLSIKRFSNKEFHGVLAPYYPKNYYYAESFPKNYLEF